MSNHLRVTIYLQDAKRNVIEPLDRKHDESHEQFAARVLARLMQLQAQPGRL